MKLSKLIQYLPEYQKIYIYDNFDLVLEGLYIYQGRAKNFDNENDLMDREVLSLFTLFKSNKIYIKIGGCFNHENCF